MNCKVCGGSSPLYCAYCDGTGREPGIGRLVANTRTGKSELIAPMRPLPVACPVHPHTTYGEIKSIGLEIAEGETIAEAYSRWALKMGWVCICPQS